MSKDLLSHGATPNPFKKGGFGPILSRQINLTSLLKERFFNGLKGGENMANTIEAINLGVIKEILSFNSGEVGEQARPDILVGKIGDKLSLVFRNREYQLRAIGVGNPKQPLVQAWTTQPGLVLENGRQTIPIEYSADVEHVQRTYGEEVVKQVLELVRLRTRPTIDRDPVFDPWEGHDDF